MNGKIINTKSSIHWLLLIRLSIQNRDIKQFEYERKSEEYNDVNCNKNTL